MERKLDPQTRVAELLEQLRFEKDKLRLAAIISELEHMGPKAHDAIPHLYAIATEWSGFQLAQIADKAAKAIKDDLIDETKLNGLIQTDNDLKRTTHIVGAQKRYFRNIFIKPVSMIVGKLNVSIQRIWQPIKMRLLPKGLLISLIFLSIVIPILNFILQQGDSIVFWGIWVLVFYCTIWSFGFYNRTYFRKKPPFRKIRASGAWYLNQSFFISWFFLETILFFLIGWHGMIKNVAVLLTLYIAVFALFGLVYGLADVSCPHCGAVNSGIKIREGVNYIDYRCLVCKKLYQRNSGKN